MRVGYTIAVFVVVTVKVVIAFTFTASVINRPINTSFLMLPNEDWGVHAKF